MKRVVLYKTGVGYFEHVGTVTNDQNITIQFTSAQLNDVLKSLTAIDLGKGKISSVSYSSVAPLEQRLGMLRRCRAAVDGWSGRSATRPAPLCRASPFR